MFDVGPVAVALALLFVLGNVVLVVTGFIANRAPSTRRGDRLTLWVGGGSLVVVLISALSLVVLALLQAW